MISPLRNPPVFLFFTIIIVAFSFYGCERTKSITPVLPPQQGAAVQQKDAPTLLPSDVKQSAAPLSIAKLLFNDNMTPVLVEEQANALPLWREFFKHKPALLLFAAKVIQPVPAPLQGEVDQLLVADNPKTSASRIACPVPDRLLAGDMGVAAAIRQGYLSRVIWVVPLKEGEILLPLDEFKAKYREVAAGWGGEIDSFREAEAGKFVGKLGGVPVDVVTLDHLPRITVPLLIHFDAGFFAASYRNQIKTPLYEMLATQFKEIGKRGYRPLAVTVSHDNVEYGLPLTMRFLGRDIAAYVANPGLVAQPATTMKLRGEMMYLDSFYQPEMVQQKAQSLIQSDPKDAGAHYAYYRTLRQARQLDLGLAELEKAIALDPIYADEYIELIQHAVDKKQGEVALTMADSAIRSLPDKQLVRLRKARLLIELGRGEEAVPLLTELAALPWADFYYPRIKEDIEGLLLQAQAQN